MAEKLFTPENRTRILAMKANKPSGVLVEVGGLSFDLVALNAGEVLSVLDVLSRLAELAKAAQTGTLDGTSIMAAAGQDGRKIADLMRSVLKRSAGVATADEESLFNEWFDAQAIMDLASTVVPKILEANGLGAILARPQTAPETTTSPST